MNGIPHAGHLRGRVVKDLWYRYKTLQGYKVVVNAGWDTQGLPVELQAEKELGVTGGKNEILAKVGIERVDGIEASYIALCDGEIAIPMASTQDHKRIYDNDRGPNTGGMGAYSPTPVVDDSMAEKIQKIIDKTIFSMKNQGMPFKGFLYAGVMIKNGEPSVLEFNVRMGDPECQPITMRMDFDLYDVLLAATNGTLSSIPPISWKKQTAVCVVLASKGYPESYPKNEEIHGLEKNDEGTFVFHAGTKKENNTILTNGGRVLGVTALDGSLESAISHAYSAAEKISWPNKYSRTDIGKKGLTYL